MSENTIKPTNASTVSFRGDFTGILRYAAEFFDNYLDYEPLYVSANFSNDDDDGIMIVDFYWAGGNDYN